VVGDCRRVCNLVLLTGSHTVEDMLQLAGHKTQSAVIKKIKCDKCSGPNNYDVLYTSHNTVCLATTCCGWSRMAFEKQDTALSN